MRRTGVTLIAIYHFLSGAFLIILAISLIVGGSVLGAIFGSGSGNGGFGMGLGLAVGMLGGIFTLIFAAVAFVAGYGVWTLREWGRILCIVLAVLSIVFSLPGLLFHMHFLLFLGGFRIFRLAINIAILWYLVQPNVRSLFQRTAPVLPQPRP